MSSKHMVLAAAGIAALLASVPAGGAFAYNRPDVVIQAHRDRQQAIADSVAAIQALAADGSRDLTAEELREVDGLLTEADGLERQIEAHERATTLQNRLATPQGRQTEADAESGVTNAAAPRAATLAAGARAEPRPRATPQGTSGFHNFGEFARAVRAANMGGQADRRLLNAATTYGSESVGADGGFAVPPDYRTEIMDRVFGEDSLIARADQIRSASNTLTLPTDMTTPWDTTGGIQAYWSGEAQARTQSKPALQDISVRAHSLDVLVPVTQELLEDAPALDSYLRRKAPEKMDFKLSYGMAWGGGVGMPLGWMNSPCLVTQTAEAAQTTDTVNATNITKMYGRMPLQSRRSAVWLIHPDAEQQLPLMTIGQQPVYLPPGGLSQSPFGTLLGRPVIPHQVCETVGDLGDVMFVDLAQYLALIKTGGGRDSNGYRSDVSMHLWFDQSMVAYKFSLRVGGQPWWSAAIAQRDGSNTQSPFVTLASR
jgi:HK97 family phage major capsid protein